MSLQGCDEFANTMSIMMAACLAWFIVFQGFSESMSPSLSLMTLLPLYFSYLLTATPLIGIWPVDLQCGYNLHMARQRSLLDAGMHLVPAAHNVGHLARKLGQLSERGPCIVGCATQGGRLSPTDSFGLFRGASGRYGSSLLVLLTNKTFFWKAT